MNVSPDQPGSGRRLATGTITVDSPFRYAYPVGATVSAYKVFTTTIDELLIEESNAAAIIGAVFLVLCGLVIAAACSYYIVLRKTALKVKACG